MRANGSPVRVIALVALAGLLALFPVPGAASQPTSPLDERTPGPTNLTAPTETTAPTNVTAPTDAKAPESPSNTRQADQLARFYRQQINWQQCADQDGFQCATVVVPRSYSAPKRKTLRVALLRSQATNGDSHARSIVFDPGGPGGSGTAVVASSLNAYFPAALIENFNIVGVDPRGVGRSTQINCLTNAELAEMPADLPRTVAEQREFLRASRRLARGCATRAPSLVSRVGTQNAARDLDVVRAALGEPKLWYLGVSYGTYLGATYASLFPRRVGRTVLDAGLSPAVNMKQWSRAQTSGFQGALLRWARGCPERATCQLPGSETEVVATVDRLLSEYNREPLSNPGGAPIGDGILRGLIQTALPGGVASWPVVDVIMEAAEHRNAAVLEAIRQAFEASYGTSPVNLVSANAAVNCFDRPTATSLGAMRKQARAWHRRAPTFGAAFAWATTSQCTYWPVRRGASPAMVSSRTQRRVQLIGGTKDPLTPYAWTKTLADSFPRARILKFTGDGHGGLGKGSTCVNEAVSRYFMTGNVTRRGGTCA